MIGLFFHQYYPTGLGMPDEGFLTPGQELQLRVQNIVLTLVSPFIPHPLVRGTLHGVQLVNTYALVADAGMEQVQRMIPNGASPQEAKQILQDIYDDTSISYDLGEFHIQYGDSSFSVQLIEGDCPPGHTYNEVFGMCMPDV